MIVFAGVHGLCYASTVNLETNPPINVESIQETTIETMTSPTPTATVTPTVTPKPTATVTPKPTATPTPEPTTLPTETSADTTSATNESESMEMAFEEEIDFFSEEEVVMMAQLIHAEAGGVYPLNRRAAVAWTVCNRINNGYSSYCTSIEGTIKEPGQFAWHKGCKYTDLDYRIAKDVLTRWSNEIITGKPDEGRILPSKYMFFWGDGSQNHFNDGKGNYWDYSVSYDPYADWE